MSKAEYKNTTQTKLKIASTYLALSIEKDGKFSVTDVVQRAKINRGTFYLHFKNLKEVERFIDEELANRFRAMEIDFRQIDLTKTPEVIINKLNEILLQDLNYFRLVINANKNSNWMEKVKASILKSISNNFQIIKYVTDYERFKTIVQFIVGGVIDSYICWIRGEINCPIEKMSALLSFMIKTGLRGCIINVN